MRWVWGTKCLRLSEGGPAAGDGGEVSIEYVHGSTGTPPCPHPIAAHTLQPGLCGFTFGNRKKVLSQAVSGRLLGPYFSLSVWFYTRHTTPVISYLHLTLSLPVPCAVDLVWTPRA